MFIPPGPSPGERVFEAGVTSRASGRGIGLAVARARQNRGDLTLLDRVGGGEVGRLWLPGSR